MEWKNRRQNELDLLRHIHSLGASIDRKASPLDEGKLRRYREAVSSDVASTSASSVPKAGMQSYALVERIEADRLQREKVRRAEHHAAAVLLRKWRERILRRTTKRLQYRLVYMYLLKKHAPQVLEAFRVGMVLSRRVRIARFRVHADRCRLALEALRRHVGYRSLYWAAAHHHKPRKLGWRAFKKRLGASFQRHGEVLRLGRGAAAYHNHLQKSKGMVALKQFVALRIEDRDYLSQYDAYYHHMALQWGFQSFLSKIRSKIRARKVSELSKYRAQQAARKRQPGKPKILEFSVAECASCKYAWKRWVKFLIAPKRREGVAIGVAILRAYAAVFRRLRSGKASRRRIAEEIKSGSILARTVRTKRGQKSLVMVLPCRVRAAFYRIMNRIRDRERNRILDRQRAVRVGRLGVCRAWRLWRAKHIARRREVDRLESYGSLHFDREIMDHLDGSEDVRSKSAFYQQLESNSWSHFATRATRRMLNRWIDYTTARSYTHKLKRRADDGRKERMRSRAQLFFIQWLVANRTAKGKYLTATATKIIASETALRLKQLSINGHRGPATDGSNGLITLAAVKAVKASIARGKRQVTATRSTVDGSVYFDERCISKAVKALMRLAWQARFSERCNKMGNILLITRYLQKRWLVHFLRSQRSNQHMQVAKVHCMRSLLHRFKSRLQHNPKSIMRRKMHASRWRETAFETFHTLIMRAVQRKQRRERMDSFATHGENSLKYDALRKFVLFVTRRRLYHRDVDKARRANNMRICRPCFRAWANCFEAGRRKLAQSISLRSGKVLRIAIGHFKRFVTRHRKLKCLASIGNRSHRARVRRIALKLWTSWTFRSINNRELLSAAQGNSDFHSLQRYFAKWGKSRGERVRHKYSMEDAAVYHEDFCMHRALKALQSRVKFKREAREIPILQRKRNIQTKQYQNSTGAYGDGYEYNTGSVAWQTEWQRFTSDEGYAYFYNETTGESVWEEEFLSTHPEVEQGAVEISDALVELQPFEQYDIAECTLHIVKKQRFINKLRRRCQLTRLSRHIQQHRAQRVFDVWHQSAIYRHQGKFTVAIRSRLEWRFQRAQLSKSFRRWVLNYYPRAWIKSCASKAVIFLYKNSIKRWRHNLQFLSKSHSFSDAIVNRNRCAAVQHFADIARRKALDQFIAFVKKVYVSKHVQSVSDEVYGSRGVRALATVWKRFAIRRHQEKRRMRKLNRYFWRGFCKRAISALQMLVATHWAHRQRIRLVSVYYRKQALGRALRQMSRNVQASRM